MTKIFNNNAPPIAEEYILKQDQEIQTDLRASDILKTKIPIPDEFIKLEVEEGNHIGSTSHKWTKPLGERYVFLYRGEEIQLDIPHYIMKQIGLVKGEDITCPFYLDPKVLKRKPERGGITIGDKEEIRIEKGLADEEEEKIKSKGEKIVGLEKELDKQLLEIERLSKIIGALKEQKHLAETNETIIQEKEETIRDLERKMRERGEVLTNLQHQFEELQKERNRLNNTLRNTQQERDRIQGELDNLQKEYKRVRWKFINSWFRKSEKSKKITDLKIKIAGLNSKLFDKNRQIEDLNNQVNRLTAKETI